MIAQHGLRWAALSCALLGACAGARTVRCDFAASGAMAAFELTDPAAWRIAEEQVGGEPVACLELHAASDYEPPHRSPRSLAILHDERFDDFELVVRARSTTAEYGHRDLVVVLAWQDPAHYVYCHFASQPDANAHHVMLVDGADRRPLTTQRDGGVRWGDGWHELRVLRRGPELRAWFDGGVEPAMVATVPARGGRVGLGSFDDTGRFADLRIRRL